MNDCSGGRHGSEHRRATGWRPDELRARTSTACGPRWPPAWAEHADYVDARGARRHRADARADRARGRASACSSWRAGPAASAWRPPSASAPGGEVVMSDVAPEMTAIAAARAEALGLANVSTRDARPRGDRPAGRLATTSCSAARGSCSRPTRRARRARSRASCAPADASRSRSGGRASATRGSALVFDAVSAQIGAPVPPPGVPGPFSLDDAGRLAGAARDAGLADVRVTELAVPLRAGSFDEWWTSTSALAGPLAKMLASLPESARRALRARLEEAVARLRDAGRARVPGRHADRIRPPLTPVGRSGGRSKSPLPPGRSLARCGDLALRRLGTGRGLRGAVRALPFATTPVGSSGRPAALRSCVRDLGDLLGRVVGREDAGLRRQVVRRRSPRAPRRRPRAPRRSPGAGR